MPLLLEDWEVSICPRSVVSKAVDRVCEEFDLAKTGKQTI